MNDIQHIFIIGSKGIPGAYGGYETFVDKLTEYQENDKRFKYHVACKSTENGEFEYHNAHCFNVKVPPIGAAAAIIYDIQAFLQSIRYIKKNNIQHPIIYCLACRIGPFMSIFQKKIHALGGKLYVNPDGHEWLRAKWSLPVRKYWKFSENLMVKYADLLICDSKNIEKYIRETYAKYKPNTTYIAYGAEIRKSHLADDDKTFVNWLDEKGLQPKQYYLVVGRFVPENNYETMIREFMASKTTKNFALITNVNKRFLEKLKKKTHFDKDPRIKFVGTVYDQELLMKIREQAYAYFHGHEVGGTNPSLLEALASSDLNLLLDVGFNREVAEDAAIYWTKQPHSLATTIEEADQLNSEVISHLASASTKRITDAYNWNYISNQYILIWNSTLQ